MKKQLVTVLFLLAPLFWVGCSEPDEPSPGPAEQIGREIDKTVLGGVKKAQEVQQKIEEKMKEAEEALQESDSEG